MDAAADPAPSEEAVDEATQALLARNATIIHTLIHLSRQRGGTPTAKEVKLAREAYDNLAVLALGFSPAELLSPAPPLATFATAARGLGLLPAPSIPPPAAHPLQRAAAAAAAVPSAGTSVAGASAVPGFGGQPQAAMAAAVAAAAQPYTAAAVGAGRWGGAMASAATASAVAAPGALLPPPGQLTSLAQFQMLQRVTPSFSRISASDQVGGASALQLSASGQLSTPGSQSPAWQQMPPPAGSAASMRQADGSIDLAWQQRQQQQQQEAQMQQAQALLQQQHHQQQQQQQQQAPMQQMHMQQLLAQQRQRQELARQQLEQHQLQLAAQTQAEQQQHLRLAHQQAEQQQEAVLLQRLQWQQEQQRLHQLQALQHGQHSAEQGFFGIQRQVPPPQLPGPQQLHQLPGWPPQPPLQSSRSQLQPLQAKAPTPGWPNGLASSGSAGLPPRPQFSQPSDARAGQPHATMPTQQNGLSSAPGLPNGAAMPNGAATPGMPPQLVSPQPTWDSGWGAASPDQRAAQMLLQKQLREGSGSGSVALQAFQQQQDRASKMTVMKQA